MPKDYAVRIKDGCNTNKFEEDKIHQYFATPEQTVYDTDPYMLIAEIDEFFMNNEVMGKSQFQEIINRLSHHGGI